MVLDHHFYVLLIELGATDAFQLLSHLLLLSRERRLKALVVFLQDRRQPFVGYQSMIRMHPAAKLFDRRVRRLLLGELAEFGFGEVAGTRLVDEGFVLLAQALSP